MRARPTHHPSCCQGGVISGVKPEDAQRYLLAIAAIDPAFTTRDVHDDARWHINLLLKLD